MGKIIQNGIEYSGTYSNATSVNYDNTNSGLEAKTVQEGLDELATNKNLVANDGLKFQFATDGEGRYGYLGADDSFIPFRSALNVPEIYANGYWRIPITYNMEPSASLENWTPKNGSYSANDSNFTLAITNAVASSICYMSNEKIKIQTSALKVNVNGFSTSYPSYIGFSSDRIVNLADIGQVLEKSGNAFAFKVLNTGENLVDTSEYVNKEGYLFIIVANTKVATSRYVTISEIKFV